MVDEMSRLEEGWQQRRVVGFFFMFWEFLISAIRKGKTCINEKNNNIMMKGR